MQDRTSRSISARRADAAVLAHLQSGILTTEEVHRFANEPVEYGGSLHWDVARLWLEIRKTLTRRTNWSLTGIGVDAWGVDYALLGEAGELFRIRTITVMGAPKESWRKSSESSNEEIYGQLASSSCRSTLLSAVRRETKRLRESLAAAK